MKRIVLSVFISLFVGAFAHVDAMDRDFYNGHQSYQPVRYDQVVALQTKKIDFLETELVFKDAHIAAKNRDIKYFEADKKLVHIRNVQGKTLLHCVAAEGDKDACKFLVEQGAIIDAEDPDFKTPLHDAAAQGKSVVCIVLLSKKAYIVNCKDRFKNSPLHYAVRGGHVDTCTWLMEKSAPTDCNNIYYQKPRDLNPEIFDKAVKNRALKAFNNRPWWQKILCCYRRPK